MKLKDLLTKRAKLQDAQYTAFMRDGTARQFTRRIGALNLKIEAARKGGAHETH